MLLNADGMPGFRLRGTVICLCSDTKGAHELGGFMSSSANCLCRLCLITRREIPLLSAVDKNLARNRKNYADGVARALDLGGNDASLGIVRDCVLNQSRYFHIADSEKQVMDAFHDFLEGTVSFTIKVSLRELFLKGVIKADTLNRRVKTFMYSASDSCNKPSPRFTDEGLRQVGNYNTKQRGAQNWCLIRMLPLLIGDLVEKDDAHFALILKLLEIMDIVFCPEISSGHPAILKHLIIEIFEMLNALFPELIPPNKWHHMIHYVDILRMFGPAIRYWCMRYEAYHNIAKRRAQANCNFINLSKSIAVHLATVLCAQLLEAELFNIYKIDLGPSSTLCDENKLCFPFNPNIDNFLETKWASVNGFKYEQQTVVLLKKSHDSETGFPLFGEIDSIIVEKENCISIIVLPLDTIRFDQHFHAYEVIKNDSTKMVCKIKDLPECEPLNYLKNFSSDNSIFISPRHYV